MENTQEYTTFDIPHHLVIPLASNIRIINIKLGLVLRALIFVSEEWSPQIIFTEIQMPRIIYQMVQIVSLNFDIENIAEPCVSVTKLTRSVHFIIC